MSERLPVVSGGELIKALEKIGWEQVRQRGSHVRLKHPERIMALVIPHHRELKRGTLNGAPCAPAGFARFEDHDVIAHRFSSSFSTVRTFT